MTRLISSLLTLILSATLWLGLSNMASAQAPVTVTVAGSGTFQITPFLGSYNAVQGLPNIDLTSTANAPWYTGSIDGTLAEAFRDAWEAENNTTGLPADFTLAFAFNVDTTTGTFIDYARVANVAGSLFSPGAPGVASGGTTTGISGALYWAAVVEVPEINGSALTQMLLVLSVGYLMLLGRRRVRQA